MSFVGALSEIAGLKYRSERLIYKDPVTRSFSFSPATGDELRKLIASEDILSGNPAEPSTYTMLGIPVILNPALAPGIIELHTVQGCNVRAEFTTQTEVVK